MRVQIRRPNNYDINVSLMLGPTEPDPTMDVSSLDIVKTVVQDSPHKLFIGGLPCDWSEDQVRGMPRSELESTLKFCWTLRRLWSRTPPHKLSTGALPCSEDHVSITPLCSSDFIK